MAIRNNRKWKTSCLSSPREVKALEFVSVILILDFNPPHVRKENKANLLFTLPSWGAGKMTQYVIGHTVYGENPSSIPSTHPGCLTIASPGNPIPFSGLYVSYPPVCISIGRYRHIHINKTQINLNWQADGNSFQLRKQNPCLSLLFPRRLHTDD